MPTGENLTQLCNAHGACLGGTTSGRLRGRCPLHANDWRRSLEVNEDKQMWYCHVCKVGGGIGHLRRALGLPFLVDRPRGDEVYRYRTEAAHARLIELSLAIVRRSLPDEPACPVCLSGFGLRQAKLPKHLRIREGCIAPPDVPCSQERILAAELGRLAVPALWSESNWARYWLVFSELSGAGFCPTW